MDKFITHINCRLYIQINVHAQIWIHMYVYMYIYVHVHVANMFVYRRNLAYRSLVMLSGRFRQHNAGVDRSPPQELSWASRRKQVEASAPAESAL